MKKLLRTFFLLSLFFLAIQANRNKVTHASAAPKPQRLDEGHQNKRDFVENVQQRLLNAKQWIDYFASESTKSCESLKTKDEAERLKLCASDDDLKYRRQDIEQREAEYQENLENLNDVLSVKQNALENARASCKEISQKVDKDLREWNAQVKLIERQQAEKPHEKINFNQMTAFIQKTLVVDMSDMSVLRLYNYAKEMVGNLTSYKVQSSSECQAQEIEFSGNIELIEEQREAIKRRLTDIHFENLRIEALDNYCENQGLITDLVSSFELGCAKLRDRARMLQNYGMKMEGFAKEIRSKIVV